MIKMWNKFLHTPIKHGTFKYKTVVFFATIYTYLFTKEVWKNKIIIWKLKINSFSQDLKLWKLRSENFWLKNMGIFKAIYTGFIYTFTKPKMIPMGGNDCYLIYWWRCERCGTMVQEDHSDPECMKDWDCPTCVYQMNFPFKSITKKELKADKRFSRYVGACAGEGMTNNFGYGKGDKNAKT